MKNSNLFIVIGVLFVLSSCVPSLNPVYNDENTVFDEKLIGSWAEKKSKETWIFSKKNEKEYQLKHLENNKLAVFDVHLAKIGDVLFLDIYPSNLKSSNFLYQSHLFPVHTFSKIEISKNILIIEILNPTWMEEGINSKQITLSHVLSSNNSLLLTASTEELQEFLLKYEHDKNAFQDSLYLEKKK